MIEDVPADAELEVRELKRAGMRVVHRVVDTEGAFREALREFQPELIISDFSMPHFDGMWALNIARDLVPDVPFLFVSGTIGEEYAIRALKNGATDYVLKNNLVRLPAAVERALEDSRQSSLRRRMEQEIRESHERFQALLEAAPDAIVLVNSAGEIVLGNAEMERIFGYRRDELLGKSVDLLVPEAHRSAHPRHRSAYMAAPAVRRMAGRSNLQGRRKDGSLIPLEISLSPVVFKSEIHAIAIVRDVTERRAQELKIARLSRIHEVLSGINSAIVRIRDRGDLFREACRIAVEHGGFGIAWIGTLDAQAQEITPVAWAGLGASEYLGGVKSTIREDLPQGLGVLAQAVKSRKPVFDNDITIDPARGGARRQEAIKRGYHSVIVLPLIAEGEVKGTLSLFARELNFFDEDEIKLLAELAGDVSFALEHIAGQERIEKLTRVRAVSSEINAAIVRAHDQEQLLRDACRIAADHGKFDMIWVGAVDSGKQEIRPLAWDGFSPEAAHAVTWQAVRDAQGTLGEAIRMRKTAVRNDIEAQYSKGGLRREALVKGRLSNVCLPLVVDNSVVALIVLFAPGREYFDKDELALLEEVASNISFALEHIAGQKRIEKLSRVRAVSGEINAAIVRIRDRGELFAEACRIAVEHGKFVMAWIGMLDEATQSLQPVATAGREEGYLERIKLTISPDATTNLALAVEAIARRAPVICNDIASDGRMRPWRAAALERGYRANAMLPLVVDQRAVGIFALYAPEPGYFDEEELKLLVELAGDVSFALDNIKNEEKLDYLAYYDALTGLPNRALFNDRLDQHVAAAHRDQKGFSVTMLDLERFRHINETLGRQAGDDLLRQVAERLRGVLGETDVLAHIGGDYFAIATRHAEAGEDVARWLDWILTAISGQPYRLGSDEIRVAARAGIALYPADGTGADALLKNAEAALKNAKSTGQHYQFYAPQMNARVAEHLKLENDLRRAILEDQFLLYYQPRVEFVGGRIGGLEALLRWKHPERGMVAPGVFIALLENTGLILDVGRWALGRAAQDHAAWRANGVKPSRIAVNVSAIQLRREDFVPDFRAVMAEAGDAREYIDIEITESMLMEDLEGNIEKLKAVREMGVQVALDDFGTGYSSLSYLARLPISSLKIDRSFITQMAKSPEQMAIVSTVISLARALNLKVVAEGVETEEQANLLRLLRCDEAQGYLFAKPMPPTELPAWVKARQVAV
jgi:diguanylate cyclase (GGDEF)-like protein/PAS domain S-box-containing protein